MTLKIGCQLEYQCAHDTPLILLLRPRTDMAQSILFEKFRMEPFASMTEYKDRFENDCQRLTTPIGKFVIDTEYIVETEQYVDVHEDAQFTLIQDLPDETLVYLLPSRFCESDKMAGKAFTIIDDLSSGYQMVEAIRQWVRANIQYEYNRSDSTTSALDTLGSQYGVCRDLSHLAIALCRSINMPARFVVGYLYLLEPMDLHAWFEVYLNDRWYTFDAKQDVVTGSRVVLAYGRDAADVATATYFGDIRLENMYVFVEKYA